MHWESWRNAVRLRLRSLFRRQEVDRELDEELQEHLAEKTDYYAARGHAPREARRLALLDMQGIERSKEECRDARKWNWLHDAVQDMNYAARVLRRSPSFTFSAIAILALGIGVNLTAFHLLNVMALKPLPVRDPHSIFRLEPRSESSHSTSLSYPAMEFYARHNTVLSAVLAASSAELTFGSGSSERIDAQFVTPNYFSELGSGPVHGRVLTPADGAGSAPVVALGYGFWMRQFGADPNIVGRTIHLNEKPVVVVGIAAQDFSGLRGADVDVWLPVASHPYFVEGSTVLTDFGMQWVQMWGRLKPGVTPQQAEHALRPLVQQLGAQHPEHFREGEYLAASPGAYMADLSRAPLPILALLALLVLLILGVACANLSNLMLARAASREREIAIRVAVGAGRARLTRQLLTESLLLALLGVAAGMVLSTTLVAAVVRILQAPRFMQFAVDWRVALVALALSALATILFGLAPSLAATRPANRATRARRALIAVQVAASCILLIVSGLLVRSARHAFAAHPGYEYERIVWLDPALYGRGLTPEATLHHVTQLRQRLESAPGVESVAVCAMPPMGNGSMTLGDQSTFPGVHAQGNYVDANYFRTMSIPMLAGRNFTAQDGAKTVIISDSLAHKLWPGQDPLGKEFLGTVVGVVGRARTRDQGDPELLQVYFPWRPGELTHPTMMIRTAAAPDHLLETLRALARDANPGTIPQLTLMREAFQTRRESSSRGAMVVSAMGLLAALLAASGVYGLVSYAVVQRQKEIGIHMALGAQKRQVLALMLRQFLKPVAIGAATGVAAAAGVSILLRGLLTGVSHLDPLSYAGAVALFAVLAGIAALVPARRALRVNPIEALRHD